MIDNNLLFSLILATINTVSFFLIKNTDDSEITKEKRNQELLILFGITFLSSFLIKLFMGGELMKGGKEKILTHATRAPF
tara:strand:- start:1544 stop:1783 length:240 start_codon:yes stop_codon:yes gene_type:complete